MGQFGVEEVPSLSNGVGVASPPLVVVGGITFYFKRAAFRLITSPYPVVPTLLLEVEMGWDKKCY